MLSIAGRLIEQDPFTSPARLSPNRYAAFRRQTGRHAFDHVFVAIEAESMNSCTEGHPAGPYRFPPAWRQALAVRRLSLNGFVKQVGCLADHRYIFKARRC